jgi:glycosyltransferase involved in cell wall biosynthesis
MDCARRIMKVAIVNYSDSGGGAARAAFRLHRGLLEIGQSSAMVVMQKQTEARGIVLIRDAHSSRGRFFKQDLQGYIDSHRTGLSNTLFSLSYPGIDLSPVPQVNEADIINLHWLASFYQSPTTVKKLLDLEKPVVWTLHDQWPFTGGCHYAAGCRRYEDTCTACPQLSDDLFGLTERVLQDKADLFRGTGLTIVTPSRWLGDTARRSILFRDMRIEVIPNSIESDVFVPQDKRAAKVQLGISEDARTLLVGAENGSEKRKGYRELVEALRACGSNEKFNALARAGRIRLLAFGDPGAELHEMGLPVHAFGYIHTDSDLVRVYAAADVFALPSLEDNLPNTMLEAMSCGTPVVAFRTGGMPDVIRHGVTGILAPFGDTIALGEAILNVLLDGDAIQRMGVACRRVIEEGYRLDVQARRYVDLFADLCRARRNLSPRAPNHSPHSLWPTEYRLKADLSVGKHFTTIEGQLREKCRMRMPRRLLEAAHSVARTLYRNVQRNTRGVIRRRLSRAIENVRCYVRSHLR